MFLITTPIKESWPTKDQEIVFLGEWCKLYEDRKILKDLKSHTVDYHWNDRKKLKKDFDYLNFLFEKTIPLIATKLNTIHKVNYTTKYWKLILGPWLMVFISATYDRWESLRLCFKNFSPSKTVELTYKLEDMIPICMQDFSKKIETDEWNHYIYSEIINYNDNNIFIEKINKDNFFNSKYKVEINFQKKLLKYCRSFILSIFQLPSIFSKIFIYQSYLGRKDLIKLNLKLNQIPYFDQTKDNYKKTYDKENFRSWDLLENNSIKNFENFLYKNISKHVPSSYLENYNFINKLASKKFWPKNPKIIFTSNAHYMDETFKFWMASKVVNFNSKLFIGQHGGHLGQGLFNFTENYEIAISDKFLSWGWNSKKNVFPTGMLKPLINKSKNTTKEKLIFILLGTDRYSHNIQSIPISSQWVDYFDNQISLVHNLKKKIKNNIHFKPYPHDYKWLQAERLSDCLNFDSFKIIDQSKKYHDIFKNCRLTISGWNSTTFLETMASNIPTIIFWDENYFELNESAKNDFEVLKKAKIFFSNPNEAAKHINEIWENVDLWWYNIDTVEAKNFFLNKYANKADFLNKIAKELKH